MDKRCTKCLLYKNIEDFHKDKKAKDGRSLRCSKCAKNYVLKWYNSNKHLIDKNKVWSHHLKRYWPHLTVPQALEAYNKLSLEQNNLCKICGKEEWFKDPRTGKIRRLSVDHCHKTGKVRGLLCNRCNKCIGQLDDSVAILEVAIDYLKRSTL